MFTCMLSGLSPDPVLNCMVGVELSPLAYIRFLIPPPATL